MFFLLGLFRSLLTLIVVTLATALVLLTALLPIQIQGASLAAWITTLVSRLGLFVFNLRLQCPAPEKIRHHHGLLFANHLSFFDIISLQSLFPFRYVSAAEFRTWPLIGWGITAVGTVFVDRANKESRRAAREQIAHAPKYPAIVLFPEGGIGPTTQLRPFHFGAFELATEHQVPYLVCVLKYNDPHLIHWRDESFLHAFWRIASNTQPLNIEVLPLLTSTPHPSDSAPELAAQAHRAMAEALGVKPQM